MKIADRITNATHSLPTEWLMATLVPHMFTEAGWVFQRLDDATNLPDLNSPVIKAGTKWYVCALLADGKIIERWYPKITGLRKEQMDFAHNVLRYLNSQCNFGGAWITGWLNDFHEFYLCWRDKDGDIQIPMQVADRWFQIKDWDLNDWAEHASQAHAQWLEFQRTMEWGKTELVKAAQGERQQIH
jgi:hypothetical protein